MSLAAPEGGSSSALQYIGIPPSWLKKRPKLPSRNWLIFLSTTAAVTGLYVYDRRKCKEIREHYIESVRRLSDDPLPPMASPRKVTVYGCKWPGDEDAESSMKYFRKYIKPIFVAAAVDYEMINGKRHGSLADIVADKIKSQRRIAVGLDPPPATFVIPKPDYTRDERARELEGGIVILGRHTFKEFMHGLKRGWSEPLHLADKEEMLSRELEFDGVFDEVDSTAPDQDLAALDSPSPPPNTVQRSPFYFPPPLNVPAERSVSRLDSPTSDPDPRLHSPPSSIPTYPPLLLVPFTDLVGFSLIPRMILGFFNQRRKVRDGAEAAYRLIMSSPMPFRGPSASEQWASDVEQSSSSDLSFDLQAESFYRSTSLPSDIDKSRKSYYDALGPKIITARQLARGEREPTKEEKNYPPPTEVELRAERMRKELQWRADLNGWEIINPATPVAWDPRFTASLAVFAEVSKVDGEETLDTPQS